MSIHEKFTRKKKSEHLTYIPCSLTEGAIWYISFYAQCPETGKLRRVRIKFNRIKDPAKRRAAAKKLMLQTDKKLAAGWNPFIEEAAPKSFHFIFNVFDTYLGIMEKEGEAHSVRSYKSFIRFLKRWLLANGYNEKMYVSQFSRRIASDIMLEIRESGRYSWRTFNSYRQFFITLFNWMIQYNYVAENPFSHIKAAPKKLCKKKRDILTPENRQQLQEFLLSKGNYNYLAMVYLCYFCCLRPNEISLLKVSDIDIGRQLVYVREEVAKNDQASARTIPDAAMDALRMLDLKQPPYYYLFSMDVHQKFVPGVKRAEGREIARYWSDVVRPGLKWPMTLQFYSLKDSGITKMLENGIAPNIVQGQADHSSLSITSIYARKVTPKGVAEIREKFEKF